MITLSNNIPFDDRANTQASINDISMVLVQDYLRKVDSKLATEVAKLNPVDVLQQMALLSGPNEFIFPHNVGLMMFCENPARFFPYTQVDIVYFPNGEAESFTEYPKSNGPMPEQIKRTLDFLKINFLKELVIKPKDRAESIRIWKYPLQAIEETLVNSFYHLDYQLREPIEIRIYANSIIFLNYGGPDRSIQIQAFQSGQVRPRRYRNRRLGDFVKELEFTEGRATGIPMIFKALKNNGSPAPRFKTDEDRSFFEVELFVHPAFNQLSFIEVNALEKTKPAINKALDSILEQANAIVDAQVYAIASTIAEETQNADNHTVEIFDRIESTIASTIADAIADVVTEKEVKILLTAKQPANREMLLASIKLQKQRKSYNEYVKPLVDIGWLSMTLPEKPTSPKQQYITTLKGRIILKLLNLK